MLGMTRVGRGAAVAWVVAGALCLATGAGAQTTNPPAPAPPVARGAGDQFYQISLGGVDMTAEYFGILKALYADRGRCDKAAFARDLQSLETLAQAMQNATTDALNQEIQNLRSSGKTTQASLDRTIDQERDTASTTYGIYYHNSVMMNRAVAGFKATDWSHCKSAVSNTTAANSKSSSTTGGAVLQSGGQPASTTGVAGGSGGPSGGDQPVQPSPSPAPVKQATGPVIEGPTKSSPSPAPSPTPKQGAGLVLPVKPGGGVLASGAVKPATLTAGAPKTEPPKTQPVALLAGAPTTPVLADKPVSPPVAKPILSGSQEASLNITVSAGTCTCANCTLRSGVTTIRFEYDQDTKGALDAEGSAARTAATSQAKVDVAAQAKGPGLCTPECTPEGISTSVTPSTGYGGSGGYGSANASWKVTGSCTEPKAALVPTITAAAPIHATTPLATENKPSYTATPILADTKPSYSATTSSSPDKLVLPAAKSTALTVPGKPAVAAGGCPAGQRATVVAGRSTCVSAALVAPAH